MKQLFIVMVFSLLPACVYAGSDPRQAIDDYLEQCRSERSTPFIQPNRSAGSYSVGKRNGDYIVRIGIQLRYAAYFKPDELREARQILEQAKTWIMDYYKSYGLLLDIHLEHAAFDRFASNPHPMPQKHSHVVYIRRHTGSHMKKSYWGVNRDWENDTRARIIAHEFSHLLQLKDEYLTALGAQSREEAASYEDDSLMKNVDHPHPRLYLRHVKKIVSPLCQTRDMMMAKESASHSVVPR